MKPVDWFGFYVVHTVPMIIVIFEWFNSSIEVETKYYWCTLVFSIPYVGGLAYHTRNANRPIYAS
jgi:hypothetical protein